MSNTNVTFPHAMPEFIILSETIRAAQKTDRGVALLRDGTIPAAGAYAAGIAILDVEAGELASLATQGIVVAKVTPAATITVDAQLCIGTDGTVTPVTAAEIPIGRSLDSSSGSTAACPHYVRVKLN